MKARRLLRLYPAAWRRKYGEELVALLDDTGVGWRQIGDVVVAAAGEWVRLTIRADKRTVMQIASSSVHGRMVAEGYAPSQFVSLVARLFAAFVAFVALMVAFGFVKLPTGIRVFSAWWVMFSLIASLIAVMTNGIGWRRRHPHVSAWLVRSGVFVGLGLALLYRELQPHFHASPFSLLGYAVMMSVGMVTGFVVDSAKLGQSCVK